MVCICPRQPSVRPTTSPRGVKTTLHPYTPTPLHTGPGSLGSARRRHVRVKPEHIADLHHDSRDHELEEAPCDVAVSLHASRGNVQVLRSWTPHRSLCLKVNTTSASRSTLVSASSYHGYKQLVSPHKTVPHTALCDSFHTSKAMAEHWKLPQILLCERRAYQPSSFVWPQLVSVLIRSV